MILAKGLLTGRISEKKLGYARNSGKVQRYGGVDDERSNKLIWISENKKVSPEIRIRRRRVSEAKKKKGFGSKEAEGVFLGFSALFMEFYFKKKKNIIIINCQNQSDQIPLSTSQRDTCPTLPRKVELMMGSGRSRRRLHSERAIMTPFQENW